MEKKEGEGVEGENSSIFQVLNAKPLQQLSLHASPHLIRAKIQRLKSSISSLHIASSPVSCSDSFLHGEL